MNDLAAFESALRGQPDDQGRPAPLPEIIHAGRRLRRRRRIATASAAAAVVAVVVGAAGVLWPTGQGAAPSAAPGAAPSAAPSAAPGGVQPPVGCQEVLYGPRCPAWGKAVDTGIRDKGRKIVIKPAKVSGDRLGISACHDGADDWHSCVGTMEIDGWRSPGYHAIKQPMKLGGVEMPMFGYYVGPAKKLTTKMTIREKPGRKLTARIAPWSEDPNVLFFWFPLEQYSTKDFTVIVPNAKHPFGPELYDWTATDRDGKSLPLGKPEPRY